MIKTNKCVTNVTFMILQFIVFFIPFVDKYRPFAKLLKNKTLRILLFESYFLHLLCQMKVVPHKIHKFFAPHIVTRRRVIYKDYPKY